MSYLAFELDALKQVPDCARAAHMPEERLGYGLLRLWSYCWTKKRDMVSLTHLAGFFGGEDDERLAGALVAFDFVEVTMEKPEPYRVKGTSRYLRISEGRSKGGKTASGNLKRGHGRPEVEPGGSSGYPPASAGDKPEDSSGSSPGFHRAASTEQRIEDSLPPPVALRAGEPEKPAAAADSQIATPKVATTPTDTATRSVAPPPEAFEPDADGDYQPTAWGFWGWHNKERQEANLFPEPTPPPELQPWHDEAVKRVGIAGLIRSYRTYLADPDFATDRGKPFAVFKSPQVWESRASAKKPKREWR